MQYAGNTNLYRELRAWNMIPRMDAGGMLGKGRYVDVDDKKLHKIPAIAIDPLWIYVNPNPDLLCMEYHAIFNGFGFIPTKCLECWKVVVAPRSFHELMVLYDLQLEMVENDAECWCKCGVEERRYVPRNFGGYFYNRGKTNGLKRKEQVRKLVAERISEDIPVVLKRFCTEFELKFGASSKYQQPKGAKELEQYFWDNLENVPGARSQPEFIRIHTIQNWMEFAWERGDKTVELYNNNEPLFPPPVTY